MTGFKIQTSDMFTCMYIPPLAPHYCQARSSVPPKISLMNYSKIESVGGYLEFDVNVFKAILSIQRFINLIEHRDIIVKNSLLITHAGMQI